MAVLVVAASCNFQQIGPQDFARQTEVRATELELHVQQTLISQQATAQVPALTRQAERAAQPTQTIPPASPPTLRPTTGVATAPAAADAPTLPPTGAVPTETPSGLDEAALQERIKTANILLFEDMVIRNNTNRYIKDTLVRMGLPFKDDGNAVGWLVDDLGSGPPNGEAWDLVILGIEDKVGAQSGLFNYALQALDAGSAVIMETWFFSSTYGSGASQVVLDRCGLDYQGDRIKIAPANMHMFPMAHDHPLLNEPNSGIPLSKTNGYWWDAAGRTPYDTGDLLKLTPDSTSELVIGAQPDNAIDHGMLAVCENGRFILQTFSSHTLTYDAMTLLWENYIYNTLKARFEAGS
jgi:hypothetical protein